MSKIYIFRDETILHAAVDEVYPFFSKPTNLQQITPPELQFRILTPLPIQMQQGTRIDYRLHLAGIPFNWRTEITLWEPPFRFRDVQLRGPYKLWEHTHTFHPEGHATRMVDEVRYQLPFAPLAPLAHHLFVRQQIEHIFAFRKQFLAETFGE